MVKQKKDLKNIIDFKNVYVNYDLVSSALENINLTINTNENWVILGAKIDGISLS